MDTFSEALKFTLKWEGGISNRKSDSGGFTNKGITHTTYDAWRKKHNLSPKSVVTMTDEEMKQIYKEEYWDKVYVDEMPDRVAIAAFDFAVNSGPGRAIKYLQRVLKVNADGVEGPITKQALSNCDEPAALKQYITSREMFLRNLPGFPDNPGWLNRVYDLRIYLGVK